MNEMQEHVDVLKDPLIRRLIAFDLDRDDFVIFGSAPLLAHGLRRSIRDLDIVARGAAWRRASELGVPAVGTISGDPVVHLCGGQIQVSQGWIAKAWNTDDLIDRAEIVQGLRFARLADVLAYKQILMRPKDIADIQALTQLLGAEITDRGTTPDEASNPATPCSNSGPTPAKSPTRRPGPVPFYRRRAGSRSAWCHWRASAETRAYFASDRTDVSPDRAISIGVPVPSSAPWVSAE